MQKSLSEENEEPCKKDVRSMLFEDVLEEFINRD